MNKNLIEFIKLNKVELAKITKCNAILLKELEAKKILGICDVEELEIIQKPTAQSVYLYDILPSRGNVAYDALIQILESSDINQLVAAEKLREGRLKSALPPLQASVTSISPSLPKITKLSSEPPSSQIRPGNCAYLADRNVEEKILEEYLNSVKHEKPLEIIVDPPTKDMLALCQKKDCYNLPKNKGLALLVNIKQFEKYDENDPHEKDLIRHGSSNDVTNLSQVLRALGLGYTIWKEDEIAGKKEKWYKDLLVDLIEDFKIACEEEGPNSIIVFIGSHGEHNKIITSDRPKRIRNSRGNFEYQREGLRLYNDLIFEFYHDKCPDLKGKPKIFIISSCQGVHTDAVQLPLDPKVSDMIICTAQVPGFEAYRDSLTGTWLVYCLTFVFMKFAKTKSLQEMLALVSKFMEATPKEYFLDLKHGQIPEIRNTGLKELYFFME